MTDGVQQWGPTRGERWVGVFLIVVGSALALLSILALTTRSISGPKDFVSLAMGAFLALRGSAYCFRSRIVLTPGTLIVVTTFRTRWFLVGQVTAVGVGSNGIEFTLRDGQKIRSVMGFVNPKDQSSGRASAKRRLDRAHEIQNAVLAAAARARIAAPRADGPGTVPITYPITYP